MAGGTWGRCNPPIRGIVMDKRAAQSIDIKHAALYDILGFPIEEDRVLEFGVLLRDILIQEGYVAGLVCYIHPAFLGRRPIPRLLVSVNGAPLVRVDYWHARPTYYCSLGPKVPVIEVSGGTLELVTKLSVMMQCGTCHYGGVHLYCGIGLVSDGECNHHVETLPGQQGW